MKSKNNIYFSFVICTYNRAESLYRTLQSLCLQNYTVNEYEIVVIDNNSTDETSEKCNVIKTENADKNISVHLEENQGVSYARNRGVTEANGKFIIFIDDDETINEDYLSILNSYIKQYPFAELAATAVIPIYEGGEPKWMSPFTQRLIGGTFETNTTDVKILKKTYPGTGHTIIKKSLFDKFGMYNTDLGRKAKGLLGAEDKDMAMRLMTNKVVCYFFPNIPVYHHIPTYKLSRGFFNELTYSLGISERIRTKNISEATYRSRLFSECIKWCASTILFFFYLITFRVSKGWKIVVFRFNVTRGLFSNPTS